MKQVVFGLVSTLLIAVLLMLLMTLYGRNLRQLETGESLAEAIDSSLSHVMREENYTIENNEVFIADFLQMLLVQLNSTSDVKVSVLEADMQLGILSVEITQNYKHPNGNEGTVSEVRTVILDKKKEAKKVYKQVKFYMADDLLYKEYSVEKDSVCSVPLPPKKDGKIFKGWRFFAGTIAGYAENITASGENGAKTVLGSSGEPYVVTEDTKLIAVFE
ncbi:MAG: hypothetical protein J6A75_06855 [Lachnospiraceae bacterium]|nr:hypothetical protein [Lachnospiraceae bacterium]